MADNDWKSRLGVVFSTNPDFQYGTSDGQAEETPTPEPSAQKLTVIIDRHGRAGKQATLIKGFQGSADALEALCRKLKQSLGCGGSVKDGEILIQGDARDKVVALLQKDGYNAKRGN